ncbi:vWA domain-containing protein [Marininema halotolerans]|uniref:Ca-activated chloride channel family protein n=1 Tax=Marininema halotolerans TaxID=1155944 RepID=A0A1I6Q409_9BACL|nr:VWA domain-containing protein [Marininema halotolerans]SFS47221.1 Ca-activated chloride channel family protein [Marininema halotolerans]
MKNLQKVWLLGFIIVLMMSGCANATKEASTSPTGKSDPKNRKVAIKIEDILKGKEGEYAGDGYDKNKVEQELDKIPKNASDEEVFNRIVALVGEDFRPEKKAYDELDPKYNRAGKKPGDDVKKPERKPTNIAILLDSSGSMSSQVSGGQKMTVAKEAVQEFADKAPKEAMVSLIAYGHKGSNRQADKKKSCKAIETLYPLSTINKSEFNTALSSLKPTGWTPLAGAIRQAKDAFASKGIDQSDNVVFVVSDGLETCGGNPAKEAKKLAEANIKATVNIIGFDVNNKEQQQLKEVAEAGGGAFFKAQSKEDLQDYFNKQYDDMWQKWIDYKNNAIENNLDQNSDKTRSLLDIHDSTIDKMANESDRFPDAITYINKNNNLNKLDYYNSKRGIALDSFFSNRYVELSDKKSKNYIDSSDQLDKDVKDGLDSVEENRKDQ